MAIQWVKWAFMRRYNPDDEWKSYTYDVYFYGNTATVQVSLSKINMWSGDVAAYAFIRQACSIDGDFITCAYWEGDTTAPTIGKFNSIDKITMELRLYGPILAQATLSGFVV
jgi:hypothetical protein